MRAIEAAEDALYRDEPAIGRASGPAPISSEETLRASAQRRADAVGLLAERALEAGFGVEMGGRAHTAPSREGSGAGGSQMPVPISGTRAARYQVVLHVDEATLAEDASASAPVAGAASADANVPSGRSELDDGTRLSAEVGIHFALVVPIRRGVGRGETPGGRRGLPTHAGGIRRVVFVGGRLRVVLAPDPMARGVRLPRLRQLQ